MRCICLLLTQSGHPKAYRGAATRFALEVTMAAQNSSQLAHLRQIPAGVWVLGFVSLLMDVSSEMIHALLPVYLVTALGVSTLTVGFH